MGMTFLLVFVVLLVLVGKLTARSVDRRQEEENRRELELRQAERDRQDAMARERYEARMAAIREAEQKREQQLLENGERFDRDLAALPRVEISLQPSPAMQPVSPVWSLFTYRNVTKASRLEPLGAVSDVLKAAQGDAASLSAWNSLVEQLLDAQPLLQEWFDKDPEDGRILILNFVSETNHGSVLLSVSEGEILSNLVS